MLAASIFLRRNGSLRVSRAIEEGRMKRRVWRGVLVLVSLVLVSTPVLWIVGERDRKYVEEGVRAVSLLPNAKLWTVPEAGHRAPWEQPDLVREAVSHFLGRAFSR